MAKVKGALDLSTLDTATPCDQGAEVEIKHPVSGDGVGIFFTVYGKDSDMFREYTRVRMNARLRQEQMDLKRGKGQPVRTMEEIEQENIALLAACTKGWRSLEDKDVYGDYILVDGAKMSFTVDNARKIYTDARFRFIYDQVNEAIADLGNFIKV